MSRSIHSLQPRFRAFVIAEGIEPEDMAGPKVNARFIAWINARWAEWCVAAGVDRYAPKSPEEHAAFDEWLDAAALRAGTGRVETPVSAQSVPGDSYPERGRGALQAR